MKIFFPVLICNRLHWEEFFTRKSRRNNTFHFAFRILRDFRYYHKIVRSHYVKHVGYENGRKYSSPNIFPQITPINLDLTILNYGKSEVDASRDVSWSSQEEKLSEKHRRNRETNPSGTNIIEMVREQAFGAVPTSNMSIDSSWLLSRNAEGTEKSRTLLEKTSGEARIIEKTCKEDRLLIYRSDRGANSALSVPIVQSDGHHVSPIDNRINILRDVKKMRDTVSIAV